MKRSITSARRPLPNKKLEKPLAVAFWLLVWHIAAKALGQEILLVSPARAFSTLFSLMRTGAFYSAVLFSLLNILAGFTLSLIVGMALAVASKFSSPVRALSQPLMVCAKATPVASFIILALVWIPSRHLSVFTSFLMGLPVFYINVLKGLESADAKLLEMAQVYHIPLRGQLRAIYAPAAYPFLLSAASSSFGMCWKAGVAAEVIGIPDGSIGEALYRAKIFLDTPDLFAWTIAVMLLSVLMEKALFALVRRLPSPEA